MPEPMTEEEVEVCEGCGGVLVECVDDDCRSNGGRDWYCPNCNKETRTR
jgi:hypothetical protein